MPTRGDVAEAAVLAALTKCGFVVLVPFAAHLPYDLAVEAPDGRFLRIQCKAGRIRLGSVDFNCAATDHGRGNRTYEGLADVFGVFCPPLDQVFMVPVDGSKRSVRLRIDPPRNNQRAGIRLAEDHTVEAWAARALAPAPVAA